MKRLLFLLFNLILVVLFAVALWQDTDRQWTRYQREFFSTLSREERRGVPGGVHQILANDFDRVDRCTTCHLAIDKPQVALDKEPFTVHPGKFLEWHPVDKFGCTVCHGGQGLATESDAAHGDVKHWEEPLLRGELVQASCRSCHGDLEAIAAHVPRLLQGQQLFAAKGCYGCHAVKTFGSEFGQTISQDLSEVGSKPYELMTADFEMMAAPHDRIRWLERKLAHPRSLNPGLRVEQLPAGEEEVFPSAMPYFGLTEEEVTALTTYLLSLKAFDPPASYVRRPKPAPTTTYGSSVERGKAVFDRYGCAACHGPGGVGGRRNWNAGLGGEVPPLLYAKAYYDKESLKRLIREGRQPAPRAQPGRPNPPLYMPAWKDRISEEDLDALADYLLSLYDLVPGAAAAVPEAPVSATP